MDAAAPHVTHYASTTDTGGRHVGSHAQLANLKKQLSDCVHCESAKTAEGKAKIQEISRRIHQIEARLSGTRTAVPDPEIAATSPSGFTAGLGSRVDTYA